MVVIVVCLLLTTDAIFVKVLSLHNQLQQFVSYHNMVFSFGIRCLPLVVTLYFAATIGTCFRVLLAKLTNSLSGKFINEES